MTACIDGVTLPAALGGYTVNSLFEQYPSLSAS